MRNAWKLTVYALSCENMHLNRHVHGNKRRLDFDFNVSQSSKVNLILGPSQQHLTGYSKTTPEESLGERHRLTDHCHGICKSARCSF